MDGDIFPFVQYAMVGYGSDITDLDLTPSAYKGNTASCRDVGDGATGVEEASTLQEMRNTDYYPMAVPVRLLVIVLAYEAVYSKAYFPSATPGQRRRRKSWRGVGVAGVNKRVTVLPRTGKRLLSAIVPRNADMEVP